jgi:hypothetical protein
MPDSPLFHAVYDIALDRTNLMTDSDELYDCVVDALDNSDPNEEDADGQPILCACCNANTAYFSLKVAKLLVQRGANVDATFKNKTPVQWLHFRGNSSGMTAFEDFLTQFFTPVITTSTVTVTKTTTDGTTTSTTNTTTTVVTTTYRMTKRAKIDFSTTQPRYCDEWRNRDKLPVAQLVNDDVPEVD